MKASDYLAIAKIKNKLHKPDKVPVAPVSASALE
jgi:hypothetical protein